MCTGTTTAMAVAGRQLPPQQAALFDENAPLDASERARLVEQHLPEVRYIAQRIHGRLPLSVSLEDLIHAGVIGLIDAVDKFDPLKCVQLKSYAQFRIRGAILDSLRAGDWSPRSLRRQARQMRQAQCDLTAALGRSPTDAELAAQLAMTLPALQQLRTDLCGLDLGSLESSSSGDDLQQDESSPGRPNGPRDDPFALCLRAEMKSHLSRAISGLESRERQVLALYYREELTMKEVGSVLGIGESRVSQIHSAAVYRLRGRLQSVLASSAA